MTLGSTLFERGALSKLMVRGGGSQRKYPRAMELSVGGREGGPCLRGGCESPGGLWQRGEKDLSPVNIPPTEGGVEALGRGLRWRPWPGPQPPDLPSPAECYLPGRGAW